MTSLRFAIIAAVVLGAAPAGAVNVTDMVLVAGPRPFYIDIFEMGCTQANAAAAGSCGIGETWKPARMDYAHATAVCANLGKRMPTLEEWRLAGSNLGRNRNYTLVGDSLYDNGTLKAYIRGSASIAPTDWARLGIDAIGTVGMTGNRYEWVSNGRASAMCGGQYETQADADVQLSNICRTDPATFAGSATVRCVLDFSPGVRVEFSSNVGGRLKDYIVSLDQTVAFQYSNFDEIFIGRNRYTTGRRRPLAPPEPNYDEEY